MKKQIIVTLLLLLATAFLTITYFKNISPPGLRTNGILQNIPGNAVIIFQYSNDKSFYDIFKGNNLFAALAGSQTAGLLDTLNNEVLQKPVFNKYFNGQNIFISLHPSHAGPAELLFTAQVPKDFHPDIIGEITNEKNSGLLITPLTMHEAKGFIIYINDLKQRFYIVFKKNDVISAGFSRQLVEEAVNLKLPNGPALYQLPSEQQRNNALANCYVNYQGLNTFFGKSNTDIFRELRFMPATATLTLNYRTDALMFNGTTTILHNQPGGYLTIFSHQQPVDNHLMDIFPATTAYSVSFGISDRGKFEKDLLRWQQAADLSNGGERLFKQIKTETGLDLKKDFNNLMANEFAVVTTRYFEKLAIISVRDGTKLKALLSRVSTASTENSGALSYEKIPFYLFGNAFITFRHPHYTVLDNYLIFANTDGEIASYRDTYLNQKFLSKNNQYNQFNTLLAERSNVNFFVQFKNAQPIFKQDLPETAKSIFKQKSASWNDFYAASWQLTASDNNFYTNFCMALNPDSTLAKNNK